MQRVRSEYFAGLANPLETEVLTLAAQTIQWRRHQYIELIGLTVDTVASFSVNRVAADATTDTSSTTNAALSDVRTSVDGSIVLTLVSGDLVLNDGTAPTTMMRSSHLEVATARRGSRRQSDH